ncbi:MAG: competence/damage-inducible protein A [Polyangiales bacterium]
MAAILCIGTELTRGELVNTNASWLADRLTAEGFVVEEIETIADDRGTIVETLRRLATRHRVIVTTGGLGPTTDDLTTACAAEAAGVELQRNEASLEAIRRRFATLGREMTPSNAKQADFPEGAEVLPNPIGTAPGFRLALGGALLFFTPGVPSEMKRMFDEQILPRIASRAPNDSHQNHLKTFGQTEAKIGELLNGVEAAFSTESARVTIGYRAHFPEIEVKVHARSKSKQEAQALADAATREVKSRIGEWVYGEGANDSFAAAVSRALRQRGLTLAIAESCTGGLVGHLLTGIAGSSEFLLLDAVVYSNSAKSTVLGIDPELIRAHGAVSAECATAMAEGARRVGGSDLAVSITGIAGPTGGSENKPVGLVHFALAWPEQTLVREHHFSGDRARVQTIAAYTALKMILEAARAMPEKKPPPPKE